MPRPGAKQPGDGRDIFDELEKEEGPMFQGDDLYMNDGPGETMQEELDRLRQQNDDKFYFIEEVEQLLTSMLRSGDMPAQEIHIDKIEDLHERAQEFDD